MRNDQCLSNRIFSEEGNFDETLHIGLLREFGNAVIQGRIRLPQRRHGAECREGGSLLLGNVLSVNTPTHYSLLLTTYSLLITH